MSKEQADELVAQIKTQFPLHYVIAAQSGDMRNAPQNYFVAINRSSYEEGKSLIIHSTHEWHQALLAWSILRD